MYDIMQLDTRELSRTVAKNVRRLRVRTGYTQQDLNAEAETTVIPGVESFEMTPSIATLERIAAALKVPAAILLVDPENAAEVARVRRHLKNEP